MHRPHDATDLGFEPTSIRSWLAKPMAVPGFDHLAYTRMADALLDALTAAGGPDKLNERQAALLKAQAMTLATVLRGEPDAVVAEMCAGLAKAVEAEVYRFRDAARRDARRRS